MPESLNALTLATEPRRGRYVCADGSSDGMDSSRSFRGRMCREETWVATTNQEEANMDATTVAVDLAKDIFEIALANRASRVIERKRLTLRQFERFIDGLNSGTEVIMEACGTAHYWGRRCRARGLRPRHLPVQYVRPYVRRNKTDRTDTDAMLEAARCGDIRPVPVKTVEQQTLQALHRVRTQWQAARTARINVVRGLLREQGLPVPVGARTVLARVAAILEDADVELPDLLRHTVAQVVDEIRGLDHRIATIDHQLGRVAAEHPVAQRLQQIPGVGVLTATALVGAVNHIHAFRRGREFASWLGLTPRESSTGGRRYLGGISKRGDVYLRCLLTHGARAVLLSAQRTSRAAPQRLTRLQQWAVTTAARRGHNKAAIALANKLARIIWAVWLRDVDFHSPGARTTAA
jgi:transposase